ncbi:catabolite repressor/activator [Aeromonas sanarellii]|uniref:Catabolite repressor/activator n=1 Tax=Aeromonas sanarellii TaxID=633415 RepID=A0ABS4B276_9GAMM|nr:MULTISPECIES: catabolite repressor/activator [Aeromonas]MBP0601593.1 catabolite repressor/activator [Aeromonas sanarellii]MEB6606541.1 catabolite repressor/activator [Aeromonas sanarellii]QXC29578.1 catabolite repressor/activator [Aeromonas sp. FDAARGOS 1409]WOX46676.1 catabolite repressor/activator [Aeromonas sp. XH]
MMKLDEIAALAGVSRTTASYVINGKADQYRISQATRDKVMAVVHAHNYQPDSRAASLRGGQTRTLGFILPDLENASYAKLAKRLEQGARTQGYQLLIVCSEDEPDTEKELARMLVSRHVDALLVASCLPPADPFYLEQQTRGVQILAIDRAMSADHFVTVASENQKASFDLTASLLSPALRHVALITALPTLTISHERRAGFEQALASHASPLTAHICEGAQFSRAEGYRLIKALHRQLGQLPEALVTTSYILMEGVLDYLLERELGQESDMSRIAMATFGDDRLLDFLPFGINSLPQQHDALAGQALTLALEAINGTYRAGLHYVSRTLKRRR